jgi:FkbM family methyltransferase
MRGRYDGLNAFGKAIDRAARYVIFVGNEQRLQFQNSRVAFHEMNSAYTLQGAPVGLVYDVGANNGDDTDYYLKKGFRVVAIEANPVLFKKICERFSDYVQRGILNVLIVAGGGEEYVAKFYINSDDKISTLYRPTDYDGWSEIRINVMKLSTIVRTYGSPTYVKVDIEGYDSIVLREIFSTGCFPEYISAESHSFEVICLLVAAGYNKFKVVEGKFGHSHFNGIKTVNGSLVGHDFPPHSSGPFGDDLPGKWMNAEEAFRYLCEYGLGWKDIHASRSEGTSVSICCATVLGSS